MRQDEILSGCLEVLGQFFKVGLTHLHPPEYSHERPRSKAGTGPAIKLAKDEGSWTIPVEVKSSATPAGIAHWVNRLDAAGQDRRDVLLFADYVSEGMAERLIAEHINYVDAQGNIHVELTDPTVAIHVSGKRRTRPVGTERSRLFASAGLKVLLLFLANPEFIHWTFREVAKRAGVSLGSVGWIISELKRSEHAQFDQHGRLAGLDAPALFGRWVEGYQATLRPTLLKRRLLAAPGVGSTECLESLRELMSDEQRKWAVTGEVAADLLTEHLVAEQLAFFVDEWPPKYERRLRWVPSEQGNIVVLELFGDVVSNGVAKDYPLAQPALVYAELLAEPDERRRETAKILAEQHLRDLVAER